MSRNAPRGSKHGHTQGAQGVVKLYALAALWLTISVLSAGLLISYFLPAGVSACTFEKPRSDR